MVKFLGITQANQESLLFFYQTKNNFHFFKVVSSSDGLTFTDKSKYVIIVDNKRKEEKNYDWKSFRITTQDNHYLLTYKLNSKTYQYVLKAVSEDLIHWEKSGATDIKETGVIVPNYTHNEQHVMYFGEKNISIAFSSDLQHWEIKPEPLATERKDSFDYGDIEVGNAHEVDGKILLTYYTKTHIEDKFQYAVGAILFNKQDPTKPIWRSLEPLWEAPEEFSKHTVLPLGSVIKNGEIILYWVFDDTTVFAVSCPIPTELTGLKSKMFSTLLKRFENNPIIAPSTHPWESRATFNSAAVYEDGKVHFLYRALGDKDLSVLGYATSKDGLTIDERSDEPIYSPTQPFETPGQRTLTSWADHYVSGGGYGGVEDPRITRVEDKMYLTYVAFDGATPPRSAMSSISITDFLNRKWSKWDVPKLITSPGMVNKSAVIFPEKVNGKYVVLHRVYPNILVDYLDDLKFDKYLQGHHFIPPRKTHWDSKKLGAGAPPIKTKDGWLLIYQSVGYQDPSRYKIGAMLLDKDNPSKVLYRSERPLIEPDHWYENEGHKAGVVYPCGAVVVENKLHVYYGGADTVVCAASSDLDSFLYEIKHNRDPRLTRVMGTLFN